MEAHSAWIPPRNSRERRRQKEVREMEEDGAKVTQGMWGGVWRSLAEKIEVLA